MDREISPCQHVEVCRAARPAIASWNDDMAAMAPSLDNAKVFVSNRVNRYARKVIAPEMWQPGSKE